MEDKQRQEDDRREVGGHELDVETALEKGASHFHDHPPAPRLLRLVAFHAHGSEKGVLRPVEGGILNGKVSSGDWSALPFLPSSNPSPVSYARTLQASLTFQPHNVPL